MIGDTNMSAEITTLYIYIDLLFEIIFIINNKPEAGEKRILEDGNTIRGQ